MLTTNKGASAPSKRSATMGNKTAAKTQRQKLANSAKIESRYAAKAVGNDDYRLDEFMPEGDQNKIVQSMIWNDLTVVNAPAGTGKTSVALWKALQMLRSGDFRKLLFIKNPTEVGDDQIGFLSGDKTDKLAAHYESTKRIFQQFMTANKLENDIGSGKIELNIPNYLLGATLDNTIVIIDEAQLMSTETLKLLIERAGINTHVIVLGDVRQTYAIKKRSNGLHQILELLYPENEEGVREPIIDFIGYVELTTDDNKRGRLSKLITEVFI